MGAADLVPGVSGGTVALMLGVYGRLLAAIGGLTRLSHWRILLRLHIGEFLTGLDVPFLAALATGILVSLLAFSRLLKHALDSYPVPVWSFFFGLVLASVWLIGRKVSVWNLPLSLAGTAAAATAFALAGFAPVDTPETWWFVCLSGAFSICAMILPGVSGAYILILLGKYEFILDALQRWELETLGLFVAGAAVGLTTFARLLHWLLGRYRKCVLAILTGLLLGSLRRLWPWQEAAGSYSAAPTLPGALTSWETGLAVASSAIGLALVLTIDWIARQKAGKGAPVSGARTTF